MCMHHRLSLRVGEFGIVYSQYVHFDAGRHQGYDRVHVLRNAGVVCKAIAVQTVSISCCAMPWPAGSHGRRLRRQLRSAHPPAVLARQAHVVEHRTCIKQLGIESEPATLAGQSGPVIDAT